VPPEGGLTPYPQEGTNAEAAALEEAGIQVVAQVCLGLADGCPEAAPGKIRTMLHVLPPGLVQAADVVALSCAGWHTLNLLPELE
jgi:maleate isomerase